VAQADANILINVITKGEQRLNAIKASINELNRLSQNLKPINLLAPGGGKLGDSLRQAIKPIQDFAREATNGTQRYSNTLAGATSQAQTFKTVLDNVKIAAGGYEKQVAAVKAYADALAGAEAQAKKLAKRQKDLLTDARRSEAGLQPQSERDIEVERRRQAINNARLKKEKEITRQKAEQLRLNKLADKLEASLLSKERQRAQQLQLIENLQLGVGFPLLFGGGIGSVVGGAAGALASTGGGFGAQILFSAVGQQLDQFFADVNEAASTVAASLGQTTEALEALAEAGIVVEKSVISQIETLEEAGNTLAAYEVLQEELIKLYGEDGLTSLRNLKQANENANKAGSDLNAVLQSELAPTFTLFTDLSANLQSALARIVPILNKLLNPFQNADLNRGNPRERARAAAQQERIDVGVRQRESDLKLQKETDVTLNQNDSLRRAGELINLGNDLLNDRVVLLKQVDIITKTQPEIERLTNELKNKNLTLAQKESLEASKQNAILKQKNELAQLNADVSAKVSQESEKRAREADRAAREALRQREKAEGFLTKLQQQAALLQNITDEERERLRIQQEYENRITKINELKDQTFATEQKAIAADIQKIQLANLEAEAANKRTEAIRRAVEPVKQIREAQVAANAAAKDYYNLVKSGILPSEAKRLSEFNAQVAAQLRLKDAAISYLEARIATLPVESSITANLQSQLELLKAERGAIATEAAKGAGPATYQPSPAEIVADRIGALREELDALTNMGNQVVRMADTIGDAFAAAFTGVITGTTSVRQAVADMLQRVGQAFISMAVEIIAKQLVMITLQRTLNALSGGGLFGGFGGFGGVAGGFGNMSVAGPSFFSGGMIPGYRNGGRPEPRKVAIVGENGPELFIPDGYGRIIPNGRYKVDTGGIGGAPNTITVNVDAKSTEVQGDDDKSRQLGTTISRVIQAELVRQQRPGGLLYGNR
jgi:hypothetical protein